MKFNCDRRLVYNFFQGFAKRKIEKGEHRWFAWYPVEVGYGDCRWLEYVCRQYFYQAYTNDLLTDVNFKDC